MINKFTPLLLLSALFFCSEDSTVNPSPNIPIGGYWVGTAIDTIDVVNISMELYQEKSNLKTLNFAIASIIQDDEGIATLVPYYVIITGIYNHPNISFDYKNFNGKLFGKDSIAGKFSTGDSMVFVRQ
ncbi:MAG: hypothetical protein D8M58_05635 [Calditrichaeota bacterium]|nr:MAG: hypothetical protein DWQ03_20870 [Calditrichota bacterium]MBL1204858.1 hypothetical protein [Calditrichota bacterium]NOG44687.1 hypothetical protein [Calditrichota bacterium]